MTTPSYSRTECFVCAAASQLSSALRSSNWVRPQRGEDMTPKPSNLQAILAAVLVVAAFITINAWTAVAKNENGWKALSAPGTIHRSGLANLY